MTDKVMEKTVKSTWQRPAFRRLRAGAAESTHNAVADGGGGSQGS